MLAGGSAMMAPFAVLVASLHVAAVCCAPARAHANPPQQPAPRPARGAFVTVERDEAGKWWFASEATGRFISTGASRPGGPQAVLEY